MKRQTNQNFLQDYDVVDAFIEHLREHGYPDLPVPSYPDKKNRTTPDIDAVTGYLAIEHTSIDTIPNQRRNNDWFLQVTQGLKEEFSHQLSFSLDINFYDGAITEGQGWKKIRQGFKNWINQEKDKPCLPNGSHWLDNVPDIPFSFHVIKGHDLPLDVNFGRFPPDNTNLSGRIKQLFDRKAKKLKKYQNLGKTTILLIENNDKALMDVQGRKILKAIQEAYPFSLPDGVDKIWYVDTAELPDRIVFKDFTSDLSAK